LRPRAYFIASQRVSARLERLLYTGEAFARRVSEERFCLQNAHKAAMAEALGERGGEYRTLGLAGNLWEKLVKYD
jgi:hypothetical protein